MPNFFSVRRSLHFVWGSSWTGRWFWYATLIGLTSLSIRLNYKKPEEYALPRWCDLYLLPVSVQHTRTHTHTVYMMRARIYLLVHWRGVCLWVPWYIIARSPIQYYFFSSFFFAFSQKERACLLSRGDHIQYGLRTCSVYAYIYFFFKTWCIAFILHCECLRLRSMQYTRSALLILAFGLLCTFEFIGFGSSHGQFAAIT